MPIWIYRNDRNGIVHKRLATEKHKNLRGEDRPARHFSETILKGYYQLECEQGSRFRSNYKKSRIRKVHETALARFDQLGETH